jgi:hypothetical protein
VRKKEVPIWEANKFNTKEDKASVFFISGKYTECRFNPLPLLSKALLHGKKDRVFFSRHILKQERFRAFRPARGV